MKIYQSIFGSLVESSIEVSNIMKQFQQLLYDFITTFYVEDFFVVNGSKKLFLKLQIFSKMIEFQNSIQDWVSAARYYKQERTWDYVWCVSIN